MERANRFIILLNVIVTRPILLKRLKFDRDVVVEVRQRRAEPFKRLPAQNTVALNKPHLFQVVVECPKRGQELLLGDTIHEAEKTVQCGL